MQKEQKPGFRERRRDAILDAALRILSHTNYELMTMDAVALEAEVTKPTLYAYFANKEALVMEAVDRQLEMASGEISRLYDSHTPQQIVRALAQWAIEHRFLDGEALPGTTTSHFKSAIPFEAAHGALLSNVQRLLNRARAEGSLDPSLDTREVARFVLTSIRDFSLREPEAGRDPEIETQTFLKLVDNALFTAAHSKPPETKP